MFPYKSPFPPQTPIVFDPGNWTAIKLSLLHNLVRLSPPREDYQLSLTNLGDYNSLERIISSLSHYPGGLSPPVEDYYLSLAILDDCHPLISPIVTPGDYQPRNKVTCPSLLEYFIPYPFFAELFWFSCLLPW